MCSMGQIVCTKWPTDLIQQPRQKRAPGTAPGAWLSEVGCETMSVPLLACRLLSNHGEVGKTAGRVRVELWTPRAVRQHSKDVTPQPGSKIEVAPDALLS